MRTLKENELTIDQACEKHLTEEVAQAVNDSEAYKMSSTDVELEGVQIPGFEISRVKIPRGIAAILVIGLVGLGILYILKP